MKNKDFAHADQPIDLDSDKLHAVIAEHNPRLFSALLDKATTEIVNTPSSSGSNLMEEVLCLNYSLNYKPYNEALEKLGVLGAKTIPSFHKIQKSFMSSNIPLVIALVKDALDDHSGHYAKVELRRDIAQKLIDPSYTLLEIAIEHQYTELASILRSFGVKTQPNESKMFQCSLALLEAFVEDMEADDTWLLNITNDLNRTVLMHILDTNREEGVENAIKAMVKRGAKANPTFDDMQKALANEPKNPTVFKVLVEECAEAGILDLRPLEPNEALLTQAIKMNTMHQYDRAIEVLKDNGATINMIRHEAVSYLKSSHIDNGRLFGDLLNEMSKDFLNATNGGDYTVFEECVNIIHYSSGTEAHEVSYPLFASIIIRDGKAEITGAMTTTEMKVIKSLMALPDNFATVDCIDPSVNCHELKQALKLANDDVVKKREQFTLSIDEAFKAKASGSTEIGIIKLVTGYFFEDLANQVPADGAAFGGAGVSMLGAAAAAASSAPDDAETDLG